MKLPCKDCLVIGICRHKEYHSMMHDCNSVKQYLIAENLITKNVKLHRKRVKTIERYMKSTKWAVGGKTERGYELYRI